jgi:hypothetical protein
VNPEVNGYSMVYDGTIQYNEGWIDIDITDFSYNGTDNLVVHFESAHNLQNYSIKFRSRENIGTDVRAIRNGNDYSIPTTDGYEDYPRSIVDMRVYYNGEGPATPSIISPLSGAQNILTNTELKFNLDEAGSTYDLYLGQSYDGLDKVVDGATATFGENIYISNDPYLSNTKYYWRVDLYDADGDKTEGVVWSFTTETILSDFPFVEDFEDNGGGYTGGPFPPEGWDKNYGDYDGWIPHDDNSWSTSYNNAHSGVISAFSKFNNIRDIFKIFSNFDRREVAKGLLETFKDRDIYRKELEGIVRGDLETIDNHLSQQLIVHSTHYHLNQGDLNKVDQLIPKILDPKERLKIEATLFFKRGNYQDLTDLLTGEKLSIKEKLPLLKYLLTYGDHEKVKTMIEDIEYDKLEGKDRYYYSSLIRDIYLKENKLREAEDQLYKDYQNLRHIKSDQIILPILEDGVKISLEDGRYSDALYYLKRYKRCGSSSDTPQHMGTYYLLEGLYHWYKKSYKRSLTQYSKAEKIYKGCNNSSLLTIIIGNCSLLNHLNGNEKESITKGREFLRMGIRSQSNYTISTAYNYIGLAALAQKEYTLAERSFKKQIQFGKISNDYRTTAFSYNNLAMISSYRGRLKSVIINFNRGFEILDSLKSRYSINVLINIIDYYINRKNIEKSLLKVELLKKMCHNYGLCEQFKNELERLKVRISEIKV